MSVTHIIAVGISISSLIPLALRACIIKWNCVWPGFENEGRDREMAKKHAVSRSGCISKHQELVREVSEGQSTMMIPCILKAWSIAAFCHPTVYRSAKA